MVRILDGHEGIEKNEDGTSKITDSKSYGEITKKSLFSRERCVFCRGENKLRAIYTDKLTLEGYSIQGANTKPHRDFKLPKHLTLPNEWEIMVCDVCYAAIGIGLERRAGYDEWKQLLRFELIRCECGKEISRSAIPKHLKSNDHLTVMEIPKEDRAAYWEAREANLATRRLGSELKSRCNLLKELASNDDYSTALELGKRLIKEYTLVSNLKAVAKIIRSIPTRGDANRVICPFCTNQQMVESGISIRSVTNHVKTRPHIENVAKYTGNNQ